MLDVVAHPVADTVADREDELGVELGEAAAAIFTAARWTCRCSG
ncbi:MAG TPA: hypothetical protein VFY38_04490 [Pseudonocardia sp.]|nr:hypothetical protein [Pseudonocardia sp.]